MDFGFDYKEIVSKFNVQGENITYFDKYGDGHIHSTFLLELDNKYKYILQKINHFVFPNVKGLMQNVLYVTEFIKNKLIEEGKDINRETLNVIFTKDGESYYYDETKDQYFRIYLFVSDSVTFQKADTKEIFALSGEAFAKFSLLLDSFDVSKLIEVIPNFHNTKVRFAHFLETLKADKYDLAKTCQEEINFVLEREKDCSIVVDAISRGELTLKVTHNDPKLNNILFDANTEKPVCVIDLDTIMPGTILYDFGDAIRFGCNPLGESVLDTSTVKFHIDYFKAFAEAYVKALGTTITENEKKYLAFAGKLMTLECGIRFLDDYLDGNKYFHINFDSENLIRARSQFKLVKDMEDNMDLLNEIVSSI